MVRAKGKRKEDNGVVGTQAENKTSEATDKGLENDGDWSDNEDEMLVAGVRKFGSERWERVSLLFDNKTGEQCKSRWTQTLRPKFQKMNETEENELYLLRKSLTIFMVVFALIFIFTISPDTNVALFHYVFG